MNGCNCAHCPRSCSDEEEKEENNNDEQVSENSCDDNSSEDEPAVVEATAIKKVERLKQAIIALGFSIENTEQGLRISR